MRMRNLEDEGKDGMFSDGVLLAGHVNLQFKRSTICSYCMNITPRVKSARNRQRIIVNVSIEIPKSKYAITHRSQQTSISPSPNKLRKKQKFMPTPIYEAKTMNTSNLNTLRDLQPPSMQKPVIKQTTHKNKSCELSPRRKAQTSRRGKDTKQCRIVRNISILDQVVNEDDNIIKYTSNSNELKQREEWTQRRSFSQKVQTHISQVDVQDMRLIEQHVKAGKESQYSVLAHDILRTACAKKIQRAWKNYKTKKLIKSYSNDIRHKYAKQLPMSDEPLTARSQGSLRFKKDLPVNPSAEQIRPKSKLVKQFQEQSIQKWQEIIQQIKQGKNIDNLLEKSLKRSLQLQQQLQAVNSETEQKIIKTKGYYQKERAKWRQNVQKSAGSIRREQTVRYFENQIMKIDNDNDISDISIDISLSSQILQIQEGQRKQQEKQSLKLRKKLEVFMKHMPSVQPFSTSDPNNSSSQQQRLDIASIIKKKNQPNRPTFFKQEVKQLPKVEVEEKFESALSDSLIRHELESIEEEDSGFQTHREWKPFPQIEQEAQDTLWKVKLKNALSKKQDEMNKSVLEQLILECLIEVSDSEKLISFIKKIYDDLANTKSRKAEGIVTSAVSIKDYLNYFINFLFECKFDQQIDKNLNKPLGPTPLDVLKYFRGEDVVYDPDSEYVMNIKIFNQHWEYANQLIYFDPKWEDPKKEADRINYLKGLTKVFFRSIFDGFNESLESQRKYGLRGKPYPWSKQKLKVETPKLQQAMNKAFQRVITCSLVFAGVHFADKQHSFDPKSIEQIQQQNMSKLITSQIKEDEILWNFYEDELVEMKLELTQHVENILMKEIQNLLAFGVQRSRG